MNTSLSRREFLRFSSGSTAALVLGIAFPGCRGTRSGENVEFSPNIYLSIGTDDTVTVVMPRSEMGQKIMTALPMILAEELEADWSRIRVVQGDYNPAFGSQSTGGSASVRTQFDRLRMAGATTRLILEQAAAQLWDVDAGECRARKGVVYHSGSERSLRYGQLVATARTLPVPESAPLKDPSEFRIIGQELKSVDTPGKVDGSVRYGYDFRVPGMLTAVVARIPTFQGQVKNYDDRATLAVPGVHAVVPISSGVAVVAENTWSALQGRRALVVEFEDEDASRWDSAFISRVLREALDQEGSSLLDQGDPDRAFENAAQVIEREFEFPFLDHAPQEPNNATAHFHDGVLDIWAPSQNPGASVRAASTVTGYPEEQIRMHTLRLGGGFGRKLQADYTVDAVEVAREFEVPVKVVRMRDEDIQHGFYRPATVHRVRAGLDSSGNFIAWEHKLAGPQGWAGLITGGADEFAYAVPHVRVRYVQAEIPVPTGAWRSVAHTHNACVIECMLDEVAIAAGQDPVEFRRSLLPSDSSYRHTLDLAVREAGWGKTLPPGHARGVAVHHSFRSTCAMVMEVSASPSGKINVEEVTAALDCGIVINPDGIRAQVEGGVAMGLTAALFGQITLENGRVEQSNFHDYPLLKLREMPRIDVHTVASVASPTGAGEPPVPPTAPALLNAIAASTGKRIVRLPLADQLSGS